MEWQIYTQDWTKARRPITRSKLAHEVARKVDRYLTQMSVRSYCKKSTSQLLTSRRGLPLTGLSTSAGGSAMVSCTLTKCSWSASHLSRRGLSNQKYGSLSPRRHMPRRMEMDFEKNIVCALQQWMEKSRSRVDWFNGRLRLLTYIKSSRSMFWRFRRVGWW